MQLEFKPKSITITAYEVEPLLMGHLKAAYRMCSNVCEHSGIKFNEEIFQEDFIAAGLSMVNGGPTQGKRRFNYAIMNPPYNKIGSKSNERQLLSQVNINTGNLYTAFLWLSLKLLEPNGEIVAITPRSFCNGPYFRLFRKDLFKMATLQRIHIF